MKDKKIAKITSNDSVEMLYIPKSIRETLGFKKGTYVKMEIDGDKLVIQKVVL